VKTTRRRECSVNTVVIGAGQAGLAMGFHLLPHNREFVILDAGDEVGLSWRRRWDSLRLFTPAGFSHLPGMRFPAERHESPTKDAMANYLRSYAEHFRLPLELGTHVESVRRNGSKWSVTASDGRHWYARNVVVATSAHSEPFIPQFSSGLDPTIMQLHSSDYQRPNQLPAGAVLVVGAGNSGAEIALDLTTPAVDGPVREIYLSGWDVGHIPPLGTWTYPVMQLLGRAGSVLSKRGLRGGAEPLGRIRRGELEAAGLERLPRMVGTRKGLPVTADGGIIQVDAVVWCTGYQTDHRFLHLPETAGRNLTHRRGVTSSFGLYVLGMPNQSSITSHLVGGVGKDAAYIAKHLSRRLD
jgi:putative flavoprotein involved in K+ transport